MPRKTKLSAYVHSVCALVARAPQLGSAGTFSSRTMIVIRIAITPSLNASRRPVVILLLRKRFGSSAVDQPWQTKPIDNHTKTLGPECFFERDNDPPVLTQLAKDALGVSRVLDVDRKRE